MGPAHLILLMTVVMCCMMNSNGEIAYKAHKNEVQNERRKIVKLLMRNFPLQESSSYHNLVEDDEVGQPTFQEGDHLTQYAPSYPYEGKPMLKNKKDAIIYYRPKVKASKKPITDLSKFEYALSTILLPPPIHTSPTDVVTIKEANDDNADEFYAPYMNHMSLTQPINEATEENTDEYYEAYMQNMYKTYNEKNMKLTQPDSEQNSADRYYLPVMQYQQPEILPKNTADQYYLPYNQYAQQQQDDWLQYYQPQSDELPNLIDGGLYDGPVDMLENEKRAESDEYQELPTLGFGNQFPGPASADNEIYDIPKILLKYQQ
eukprot:GFUD01014429.1.p1 GENE.GFUD01014429.1~~GFUD01014429.1.p1  ORF type:complete len:318 (+),score=70.13 GFUD01014429.1:149-1102(+)